ncbi:hypothetical protein BLNAU_13445 [Blattamonas nauphoetae]|uniref:Uncharacterized protein n=1 Tax=Blattamonas nauphoetae TaxID=2049346 RepID=A0ABQ9XGH6_9EUKA|nr:hypothetical protein BLNAU_23605 [Blattamonas nauphoetae]KAK2951561.1 hypothetical protein BLNAU_13445 [Blattamonas nauphoetae]
MSELVPNSWNVFTSLYFQSLACARVGGDGQTRTRHVLRREVDAIPVAHQSDKEQVIIRISALIKTQGTIASTLLHPPLVIFPPAPTLSHPRLVFTSSLSHVKVGEYYISTLSRTSPNYPRRMNDKRRDEAKLQLVLLNDRLLSPPNNWKPPQQPSISTPCEESTIILSLRGPCLRCPTPFSSLKS